ncbi:class II aldolase/adducin family protein [Shewanella woodyi]|uniref:class II aldolase/adducin family protein n=1 Tax=Shewanella woodyi TaxID=60961 RepID=UPI0009EEF228|nr:class II aldolase/adducin family protein [Shewanella woodyi]
MSVQELAQISAKYGRNLSLVQGAGGNTSYKCYQSDCMWIKASGKWLGNALNENIFIPLKLSELKRSFLLEPTSSLDHHVMEHTVESGLRPSIETSMHALLPHKFVVHLHSTSVLAWLVQKNIESNIAGRLTGLHWCLIDYVKPGAALTESILNTIKQDTNIILLKNHGVVILGKSVTEIEQLVREVESRLYRPKRSTTPYANIANLLALSAGSDYRLPSYPDIHSLALNKNSYRTAKKGPLFPDQVVFLGESIKTITKSIIKDKNPVNPPQMLLMEGKGVLINKHVCKTGEQLAYGLSSVLLKLPEKHVIRYLSDSEIMELTNWDAETYRRSMTNSI